MSPTFYPERPDEPPSGPVTEYEEELPPLSKPKLEESVNEPAKAETAMQVAYRGATSDPIFGLLLALALSIGLLPLLPENADFRYTVVWLALAGVGVLAWLLGNNERIGQEKPENIAWGVAFGALLGIPLLGFGGNIMATATRQIFPAMPAGTILAYLIFVMPLAETLFFRGVIQHYRPFWMVGLWSAIWNIVLFFPVMWDNVVQFPAVTVVIAVALVMMNLMFSYVRDRNGLAAAWMCQIVINVIVIFLPVL